VSAITSASPGVAAAPRGLLASATLTLGTLAGDSVHVVEASAIRTDGTGDALEHGVTGLRINGADPQAVKQAMARILEQPQLAASMAAAGRQRAVDEFAWERIAEKTLAMDRRHPL